MIEKKNIKINTNLFSFINTEVLNDLNISEMDFWNGFSDIVDIFYKKNIDLLNQRKSLQSKINDWHIAHKSKDIDLENYKKFLKEINYIVNEGPEFKITTSNVDKEISPRSLFNLFEILWESLLFELPEKINCLSII